MKALASCPECIENLRPAVVFVIDVEEYDSSKGEHPVLDCAIHGHRNAVIITYLNASPVLQNFYRHELD